MSTPRLIFQDRDRLRTDCRSKPGDACTHNDDTESSPRWKVPRSVILNRFHLVCCCLGKCKNTMDHECEQFDYWQGLKASRSPKGTSCAGPLELSEGFPCEHCLCIVNASYADCLKEASPTTTVGRIAIQKAICQIQATKHAEQILYQPRHLSRGVTLSGIPNVVCDKCTGCVNGSGN